MKTALIILSCLCIGLIASVIFLVYLGKHDRQQMWDLTSENATLQNDLNVYSHWIQVVETERDFANNELKEALALYDQKEAEAEQIAAVACPRSSHVWDRDGDIIRCRRCGLTRRVDNAAD